MACVNLIGSPRCSREMLHPRAHVVLRCALCTEMHRHDHDVVGLRRAPHEASGAGNIEEVLRPRVRSGSDHGDPRGAHGQPGDLVRAPCPAKAGTRKRADRHRLAHVAEVGGVVVRQVQQHEADRSQARAKLPAQRT
jgi:hypothetical protein